MVKEKIMETTIALIKEYGDTDRITMREIADKAGVGLAMINYHFQTKDNLIYVCMLKMVGHTLENFEFYRPNSDMKAIDKMREIGKGIAAFMVTNPGFGRVAIMNDLVSPNINDNSNQIAKMFLPIIKEIYVDEKTDQELLIMLYMLISSIEVGFLRRNVMKETLGIDLSNAEQRDKFVEYCIHTVVNKVTNGDRSS